MSMIYCLNTSTIRPQPLLEKIRVAAAAGYQGVELWVNDVYEHIGRGGEARDVEHALADAGLIVPCMIAARGWGEAVGPEYPLALDDVKRRLELAARLGSPYLVATPPREPCDLSQLTSRYRDLLEIGRQAGCRPTFEYISFFRSAYKLSHAWQVVQDAGDPDATLIYDSFHTWNSGSTLEELSAVDAGRIAHWHIDDAAADKAATTQTDPDRVMPGDGQIPLAQEIRVMRQIGYQGTVSLELFNVALWERDPSDVLRIGLERMRALFE